MFVTSVIDMDGSDTETRRRLFRLYQQMHRQGTLTARIDLPSNTLKELIAYAKANPGKVTYASQGNGSTSHLSAQMLATMAGIELVHVPYKGEGPALVDLTAGRVDIFIGNISAALRFEKTRQAKFLGLASRTRSVSSWMTLLPNPNDAKTARLPPRTAHRTMSR
jgi:tripartite-type tricarboxylate transporter receptor subunit TctC